MNLLRHRYHNHPQWFRSNRICFIDTMFTHLWSTKYQNYVDSHANPDGSGKALPPGAIDYYTGELPAFCRSDKVWGSEVHDIYTIMNINDNHWIALWISIPNRKVVVWDSLFSAKSVDKTKKLVEPFAVMVPNTIRELCHEQDRPKYSRDAYTIEVHEAPQQADGASCGVFAFKFVECHALGFPFSVMANMDIQACRDKLAVDIWDEIKQDGPQPRDWSHLDVYEP